jgi:hypothetical protein
MAGIVRGVQPEAELIVQETLWDGERCRLYCWLVPGR